MTINHAILPDVRFEVGLCGTFAAAIPPLINALAGSWDKDLRRKAIALIEKFAGHREWQLYLVYRCY